MVVGVLLGGLVGTAGMAGTASASQTAAVANTEANAKPLGDPASSPTPPPIVVGYYQSNDAYAKASCRFKGGCTTVPREIVRS